MALPLPLPSNHGDNQDPPLESSLEGSPLLEEASVLLRIPPCMAFIVWKNDGMVTKECSMVEVLSIKERKLLKDV